MEKESILRLIGNATLVLGYFIMLWFDLSLGLIIKCIGGMLTVPFAFKLKLWDVLVLCGFFFILDLTKILHLAGFLHYPLKM